MPKPTILSVVLVLGIATVTASQAVAATPAGAAMQAATDRAGVEFSDVSAQRFARRGFARRSVVVRRGGGVAVRRGAVAFGPRGAVGVRRAAVVGPRGNVAVRRTVVARPYRPWVRRAYYGTVIGGVALGTLIAASAVPAAPAPNLCWYWADQAQTQGYWDYCRR
jgi:hypothetical protein